MSGTFSAVVHMLPRSPMIKTPRAIASGCGWS
jgi:hypothetical protein